MKKLFAVLLSLTMLLSLTTLFSLSAAAVDGAWTTYAAASQYAEGFDGDPKSVPGYEYTADGFHMIPGNWAGTTPWGHIQTKDPIDLKDGVYMLIRVDDFSYDTSDRWFNVNIWDSARIEPPVAGYGEGVQTLIRPTKVSEGSGDITSVAWYTHNFTSVGSSNMVGDQNKKTSDGQILIEVTVTWNGSSYAVDINGAKAPKVVTDYMNEKWGGNSEAYVGICTQNNKTGGTVELTVMKFGTTKSNATTPIGDDSRAPENHAAEKAPIADPSTVPANEPAVFMNGNKVDSDLKAMPKPIVNTTLTINDDYSLHITANQGSADSGVWYVKNDVSYDIKDFPIGVILMKNLCTCGTDDGTCYAIETVGVYMMTGESMAIGGNHVSDLNMSYDPYVIGEDKYLYFYVDMINDPTFQASGRINGACFDILDIDYEIPGANSFDRMFMAWFRTLDEAQTYIEAYLTDLGWSNAEETTEAVTEAPEETSSTVLDTEADTKADTDADTEDDLPSEGDTETLTVSNSDGKEDESTEAPKTDAKDNTPAQPGGGCGSFVGFSTVTIVMLSAIVVIAFKKKD